MQAWSSAKIPSVSWVFSHTLTRWGLQWCQNLEFWKIKKDQEQIRSQQTLQKLLHPTTSPTACLATVPHLMLSIITEASWGVLPLHLPPHQNCPQVGFLHYFPNSIILLLLCLPWPSSFSTHIESPMSTRTGAKPGQVCRYSREAKHFQDQHFFRKVRTLIRSPMCHTPTPIERKHTVC